MGVGRRLFTAAFLTAAVLSAIAVPASAVTPTIAHLTPLLSGMGGSAQGINDSGVIVGWMDSHATKWTPDGKVTELGKLPGMPALSGMVATAINNTGTIVGYAYVINGPFTAVRWAPDGTIKALAKLPAYRHCTAEGINDGGVIVGRCYTESAGRAVRWNLDGTITTLTTPSGHLASSAYGINAAGAIVGVFSPENATAWAVRWNPDGTVTHLANLPGAEYSEAKGINDRGQIVGTMGVYLSRYVMHAIRWNTDGTVTALPTPADAPNKAADSYQISPDGTVVGRTLDATTRYRAAAWSPSGTLTVLPSPGEGSRDTAVAINKRNVIVGVAGYEPVRWTGSAGIPCTVKPFCASPK